MIITQRGSRLLAPLRQLWRVVMPETPRTPSRVSSARGNDGILAGFEKMLAHQIELSFRDLR